MSPSQRMLRYVQYLRVLSQPAFPLSMPRLDRLESYLMQRIMRTRK